MKLKYITLLLFIPITIAAADLPDLGDVSEATLSLQQERRIGKTIMREVRADRTYLNDAEINDYLNNLGHKLIANSPDSKQELEFFAIEDNAINAFALPGGYIGVHSGLILAAENESELASVLAHETAHITQRHLARMLAGQKQQALYSLAALALAILASRSNNDISSAAIAGAQAGSIQSQLNFTREHEQEADRIGVQRLYQAGFDPRSMVAFFNHLQKAIRIYETNAPGYLRTHPLTFERIADIENRVQNFSYKQVPDSLDFQLIRSKLRVLANPPKEMLTYFQDSLLEKKYSNEAAQRYGLVATLIKLKQYSQAEKELDILQSLNISHPMFDTLTGQLKTATGQNKKALEVYRHTLQTHPYNRALIYEYTEALLREQQADKAVKFIRDKLPFLSSDAKIYQLESRSYAALGKNLLQHQAQAEYYFRSDNLPAAIEQLQIAQKSKDGNFYQMSAVEARLKELQAINNEDIRNK